MNTQSQLSDRSGGSKIMVVILVGVILAAIALAVTLWVGAESAEASQISSHSAAATGNAALIAPPTTRYYAVHPSAFSMHDNLMGYLQTGTAVYGTDVGQPFLAQAPVNLPHGAVIESIDAQVSDSSGSDINIVLWASPNGFAPPVSVATLSSSGTPGATTLSESLNYEVDNSSNSYTLFASWEVPATPSNMLLGTVRITYTVTPPLP